MLCSKIKMKNTLMRFKNRHGKTLYVQPIKGKRSAVRDFNWGHDSNKQIAKVMQHQLNIHYGMFFFRRQFRMTCCFFCLHTKSFTW